MGRAKSAPMRVGEADINGPPMAARYARRCTSLHNVMSEPCMPWHTCVFSRLEAFRGYAFRWCMLERVLSRMWHGQRGMFAREQASLLQSWEAYCGGRPRYCTRSWGATQRTRMCRNSRRSLRDGFDAALCHSLRRVVLRGPVTTCGKRRRKEFYREKGMIPACVHAVVLTRGNEHV